MPRILLGCIVLSATSLWAGNAGQKRILADVEIAGLKRTQKKVILQYVDVPVGASCDALDVEELRTRLERLKIFSEVHVMLVETNASAQPQKTAGAPEDGRRYTLKIEVREKWSLYPIPVYVKYRDTEIGGAFLVESNFLGRNQGLAAGGLISNRGWQALAGFTDPHIAYSRLSTTMRYLTGRVFLEDSTPGGKIERSYTMMRHDIQSATGYNWRSGFFAGVIAGYRSAEILDNPAVATASVLNSGIRLRYSNIRPMDFFQSGFESTLDAEKGISFAGDDLHVISNANALHVQTFKGQFVSWLFSFQYSHYPDPLEQRLGGWQGTRTLPALLVPADKFVVTALNYQVAAFRFPWAVFALQAFFDAGTAKRDGRDPVYFYGPGAGVRMYLSEITIPALGIDVAQDMLTQNLQISFFIGYNLQ